MTFQTPVTMSTPNAGHAIRLKSRAAARGASVENERNPGTNPARVSCPPTHTVAARTWRKRRTVVAVTRNMRFAPYPNRGLPAVATAYSPSSPRHAGLPLDCAAGLGRGFVTCGSARSALPVQLRFRDAVQKWGLLSGTSFIPSSIGRDGRMRIRFRCINRDSNETIDGSPHGGRLLAAIPVAGRRTTEAHGTAAVGAFACVKSRTSGPVRAWSSARTIAT